MVLSTSNLLRRPLGISTIAWTADGTCVPGSYMASEIMDARSTLHHDCYLDTTVDVLCSAAGRLHAADLEFVVGQLAQTRGGPA